MTAVLAPSILAADFARLGEAIREAEAGGAGMIHVDVMDGRFVPNITIGPAVTAAVRGVTDLPVDCHLMIVEPERYVQAFARAGADMISVHAEATCHLHRTLEQIREAGCKAGVVLNPATPLCVLDEVLGHVDYVLLMSVNPGFSGQKLIPSVLEKAARLKRRLDDEAPSVRLELDGGVREDNLEAVLASGADMVVAGSAVFGAEGGPRKAAARLVQRMAAFAGRTEG